MGVRGRYSSRRFGRHTRAVAVTLVFVLLWTFREQLRLDRVGLDPSVVPWMPRPPQDIFNFEPLDSDAIRAVCGAVEWDAKSKMQVVFTCDNNVGGIANIRNSILNCVRYAMLAGGSLVLPRIFVPSEPSGNSVAGTGRRRELGYMFDRDHFVDSLRLSCPQLRLFNDTDEVFERIGRPRTWSLGLFPESLVEEENIPSTGIEHPEKWRSLLYEWLGTIDENLDVAPTGRPPTGPMLVDLGRSYLTFPIDRDGEVFATTFGNILKFRADVRALATAAILGIDRHFLGAHLRTGGEEADDGLARWAPSDPMWQWTEYAKQTDAYLDQAGRWGLSVVYVGGGNETQAAAMGADAGPRGVTVLTKRDLLVGENRKRLDALGGHHQDMIDFLVMLGAAQFGGVGHSSFAWNVALKRHIFSVEKERFLEGPQMLSDELSQVYGTRKKYPEYASCMWP